MIETSKKKSISLEWVSCIYYPLHFQKDNADVRALIDSGSEVNAMTPAYLSKLGLKVYHTNVGTQKINKFILEIFEMVLANFQIENKLGRAQFY